MTRLHVAGVVTSPVVMDENLRRLLIQRGARSVRNAEAFCETSKSRLWLGKLLTFSKSD